MVGFFAFAAIYHGILWTSSRKEVLLAVFSFDCLVRAGLCLSLFAIITATTPEEAFTASRSRVSLVALTLIASLWSFRQVSGVRADRFVLPMTTLLLLVFVIHTFITPLNGTVIALGQTVFPWGEVVSRPVTGVPHWWMLPLLAVASTIEAYGIHCGLHLARRDRVAGSIVVAVAAGTLFIFVVEGLRAYHLYSPPILGAFPHVLWVCLFALLIARGHDQTRRDLIASQQRYRGIFDQTFQFIGLLSPDGRVVEANRSALEFAGVTEADVIGKLFWETAWWSHSRDQQARLQEAVRDAAAGQTIRFEVTHHRHDGRIARIDFSIKPIRDASGVVTLLIPEGRDISELKGAEETIRQILETVATSTGRDFLVTLTNHLCGACQVDHAFIGALDENDPMTVRGIAFSHSGVPGPSCSYNLKDTPCERVLSSGFCFHPTGVQQAFPHDPFLQQLNIDSYMGIPLKSSDGVSIGLFVLLHGTPIREPEQAQTLMRVVAARAGAELEREIAEVARRETESRHRAILESSLDGVIVIDSVGTILEFNPAAERLFGYSLDQVIGRPLAECILPAEMRDSYQRGLQAAAVSGTGMVLGQRLEMPAQRADGSMVDCELAITRIPTRGGPLYSGIIRDITARRQAEQRLRSSQTRLSTVIENAPGVAVQWYDSTGRVLLWNRASEEMYGYNAEEAIGKTLDQLILTRHEQQQFLERLDRVRQTLKPIGPVEAGFRRRNGERRDCQSTLFAIPGENAERWFVGMDVDITDRKATERALQDRETFLRLAQEAAHVGSWEWNIESSRFKWSDELARMHGISVDEFDGSLESLLSFCTKQERERVRSALSGLLTHAGTGAFEYQILSKTGAERDLWILGQVTQNRHGLPTKVLGVAIDITDRNRELARRRNLESQLAQSQKLEAIGRLAGGIAHDFNNLLTVINGYTELLLSLESAEDEKTSMLTGIQAAGQRAASLTRQLLTFSRKQVLELRPVDLNEVVTETEQLLRRLIGENIRLKTELASVEPVLADSSQMTQIIVNLAVNGRDAMPDGGTLTLCTRRETVTEEFAAEHPDARCGDYIVLSVTDTGCGMSPEVQARIFEPFFTTKAAGQGTGLGLPTVRSVTEQSGGFVRVISAPGQGTVFEVYLPVLSGDTPRKVADSGEIPTPMGTESILLVEDEDAVRALTRRVLEQFGYHVTEASGGAEALELIQNQAEHVDLVITDVVMPEMGGEELVARLKQIHPQLRILYLSGYTDDAVIGDGTMTPDLGFLQKPFTVNGLAQKVRQMLNA